MGFPLFGCGCKDKKKDCVACSDIHFISEDSSIIILPKGDCLWDLTVDYSLLPFFVEDSQTVDLSGNGHEDNPLIAEVIVGDEDNSIDSLVVYEDGFFKTRSASSISGSDTNFANTDLTFDGDRLHDLDGNVVGLVNGFFGLGTDAPTRIFSIEEEILMFNDAPGGLLSVVQASSGKTMSIRGGRSENADGIELMPNAYGSNPSILIRETIGGNNIYAAWKNSGANDQLYIGIDNEAEEAYIEPVNATTTIALYRELRFDAYPASRNDGPTTKAFYSDDETGAIKYGPIVGGGEGGSSILIHNLKLADYTVGEGDNFILADASAGDIDITLPAGTSLFAAFQSSPILIKRIDNSVNVVNVIVTGADTIEGLTGISLINQWDDVTVIPHATGYYRKSS